MLDAVDAVDVTPAALLSCSSGDPCRASETPGNACLSNGGHGRYQCSCGLGYQQARGGLACEVCTNPCSSDPCGSRLNAANVCLWSLLPLSLPLHRLRRGSGGEADTASCASFTCSCAPGFSRGPLGTSCAPACLSPCSVASFRDPCQRRLDPANQCYDLASQRQAATPSQRQAATPSFTGFVSYAWATQTGWSASAACGPHVCECGAGWQPVLESTACARCPADACAVTSTGIKDACATSEDAANVCRAQDACGRFTCECGGFDWILADDKQSCRRCDHSCSSGDPCQVQQDSRNRCSPGPGGQGKCDFKCECAAGWQPADGGRACTEAACYNPCVQGDPCAVSVQPSNVCINTRGEGSARCGAHLCGCAAGWKAGQKGRYCIPVECPDACDVGASDPCATRLGAANTCMQHVVTTLLRAGGPQCGVRSCRCGEGWHLGPGEQSCVRVASPAAGACAHDECSSVANPDNRCHVASTDSGYFCTCAEASGWLAPYGSRRCLPPGGIPRRPLVPINLCMGHDRCQAMQPGNMCVSSQGRGRHACVCGAVGFTVSDDRQDCLRS